MSDNVAMEELSTWRKLGIHYYKAYGGMKVTLINCGGLFTFIFYIIWSWKIFARIR